MARRTASLDRTVSTEKLSQVSKFNMRLKTDFLAYLKSIKRSPGTITGYDSDLNIIFTYILDNLDNKQFNKLTKRDIIAIQNWMVDSGLSSARIRRLKAAMSSLSNYCENILSDDDPEFNNYRPIVRKIENPPLQAVREKTVWADEELANLLNTLVEAHSYEKACFVALGMYSGRRKSELCRFKVSDFADDKLVCDGALYKSAPILTKGGKYLECYVLAKKFKPYFNLWMDHRKAIGLESEWLFPNHQNKDKSLDITSVTSWVKTFSNITGRDFYMHSLRHYYCTALLLAGIPDNVVVDIIGWSSSDMLKIYDDSPKDKKLSMYFKDGDINVDGPKGFDEV